MSTQINTEYWGQPLTLYTNNNVRTGATDLNDPDFENYPAFVGNDYGYTGEIYQYVNEGVLYYSQLVSTPVIELNEDIDNSIAYCACKNMDIPINQIVGFSTTPGSGSGAVVDVTGDNFWVVSKDEPIPLTFFSRAGLGTAMAHGVSGSQYFFNPEYTSAEGYTYCQESWEPHASNSNPQGQEGTPDSNTGRGRSNKNLFLAFWRDFGIRSVFLQIDVKYFDGTYSSSTGTPQNVTTTSLYTYSQNTLEWRAAHPLIAAFAKPYRRNNTNGTYGTTADFICDLSKNLISRFQYGSISPNTAILQPVGCLDTNDLSSCFLPIFGGITTITATPSMGTNSSGGVSQRVAVLVGGKNGVMTRKQGTGTSARACWLEMQGTDDNIELIRKWCAAYGLFFTDGRSTDSGYSALYAAGNDATRWTDEKMCLGVVDDEGYTDGTYTRGTGNEDANNFDWKTASQSPYDPIKPPPSPENQYSTETTFNSIGDVATMTKRYVLTGATVKLLAQQLWTITENMINVGGNIDFSELSNKLLDQFLTSNPIDCIVSLQRYPMEIPAVGDTTIVLGKYDTSLHAKPMEKTAYFYLFNGNTINPKFGDSFLDYQPFTKMELYVPFCGTIQINPADILGRKLNVQLVVDFTTGTATGFVMSDNLVIETVNGNIAIDIPVTGIQQTTVAGNLYNAIAQRSNAYKQEDITGWNRVSLGGALEMFWGDAMGASETFGIKGKKTLQREIAATNREKADYDLTHQSAPVHIIGSASPAGGWAIDLNCRLLIYYPTGDVILEANPPKWNNLQLARYGRTTGFACCIEKAIGDMGSGLVVGTAPRLDLMTTNTRHNPATIEELDMIRAAIEEGVILPTITE